MANFIIGVIAMGGLVFIINYVRQNDLKLVWWQWGLTILCLVYSIFVLEVIASFLAEGAAQAAIVMGSTLAVIAIVWGVLLQRFVFSRRAVK